MCFFEEGKSGKWPNFNEEKTKIGSFHKCGFYTDLYSAFRSNIWPTNKPSSCFKKAEIDLLGGEVLHSYEVI